MKFSLPGFGKASLIGLDIGASSVKAVEVSTKTRDKGFELRSFGRATLASEAIVQGAFLNSSAIADAIREAVATGHVSGRDVAAAVSGHSVIVKRVSLPLMSREELEDQIQWEAEQYIPFDVNEVNLDFQILETNEEEGQMDVLLVAAKRDLIDDYVQVITEAGLNPVAIDVAGFAVQNAYEMNYEQDPDAYVALVNIGAQVVNINILRNGIPAFNRDIMTGGSQYTEEIQKALSVSFDEAERIKIGAPADEGGPVRDVIPQEVEAAMRGVSEALIGEISRSLDFFTATAADAHISRVLLAGGGARVTGLATAFEERTGIAAESLDPLARMLPSKGFEAEYLHEMAPSMAVAIGLATRRVD
jgi:type IV pilus assembly protein PilM